MEIDEKKLEELEINALALQTFANKVLAGVAHIKNATSKPVSKKRKNQLEIESQLIQMFVKRASRKKIKNHENKAATHTGTPR